MEPHRMTGPEAGVLKYDLLTALTVLGLNGSPTLQTSLMRLVALVTARYNWRNDEFSVGQRDIARMWSVNERTVKREMKRLIEAEVLVCKRSGVRGRVGAYALNYRKIAAMSEPCWRLVGPDFEHRMRERYRETSVKVVQMSAYVQEPDANTAQVTRTSAGTWERAMAELAQTDPHQFEAWFARLEMKGIEGGILKLSAPSKFIQRYIEMHHMTTLIRAAEQELGPIDQVQFLE